MAKKLITDISYCTSWYWKISSHFDRNWEDQY